MLHILLWLHTHVSSVCFNVFQMFQTYVAKVDLEVAYIAMAIHACFNVSLYVANVLSLYFKSRSGVAHVAMRAGDWRTAAYRSRLVLLRGHCRGSRAGAAGLTWFMCGHRCAVLDTGVRCEGAWGAGCDAGRRWVQARSSVWTGAVFEARFGVGRSELRASGAGELCPDERCFLKQSGASPRIYCKPKFLLD
jgi:hypothetical protein